MADDAERLRALLAAAMKQPWHVEREDDKVLVICAKGSSGYPNDPAAPPPDAARAAHALVQEYADRMGLAIVEGGPLAALRDAVARALEPSGAAPSADAGAVTDALRRLTTFVDGKVRGWLPREHTNCLIDSGCAHGADEREMFDELEAEVERADAAIKRSGGAGAEDREGLVAKLSKWAVWTKNGRSGLYHAIDGDVPTEAEWREIGSALAALAAARPQAEP
jgi:hypothetical protein